MLDVAPSRRGVTDMVDEQTNRRKLEPLFVYPSIVSENRPA
jgi:hypothetical protein